MQNAKQYMVRQLIPKMMATLDISNSGLSGLSQFVSLEAIAAATKNHSGLNRNAIKNARPTTMVAPRMMMTDAIG